jgi:phosphate transport system protein
LLSFADYDPAVAREVLAADDEIDDDEDEAIRATIQEIKNHPEATEQQVDFILIAKSLERVGDHATNIAEDVILVAEALNLKHAGKLVL